MEKVSRKIRHLRQEQKLSLRALAEYAGISASALSQIEAGQSSPSVATLDKICQALGQPITVLFDEQECGAAPNILGAQQRRRIYSAASKATLEALVLGLSRKKIQPLLLTLDPGGECGEYPFASAGGEEFAFVVRGDVQFEQEGAVRTLQAGDAVYFDSQHPHNWRNPGAEPASVLVVFTR